MNTAQSSNGDATKFLNKFCFKCGRESHIARACRYQRNTEHVKYKFFLAQKKKKPTYILPSHGFNIHVDWSDEQKKDKIITRVIEIINKKLHVNHRAETKEVLRILRKRRKLVVVGNILCRSVHGDSHVRIIVPRHLQTMVVHECCNNVNNSEPQEMVTTLQRSFYWPGMQETVDMHFENLTAYMCNAQSFSPCGNSCNIPSPTSGTSVAHHSRRVGQFS